MAAAQEEMWCLLFSFYKSVCLKTVVDLGIPDSLHRLGGRATAADLHSALSLPPERLHHFARLMRVTATTTSLFTDHGEAVYGLTPASRLLLKGNLSMSPIVQALLQPQLVAPCFRSFSEWFKDPGAPATAFEMVHGATFYELPASDPAFNKLVNACMASDSRLFMDAVLKDHRRVFAGVSTLVDVGGGAGGASAEIAEAFPEMKCSVLDLPHVVAAAPAGGRVEFVAGDMFAHIPRSDAVLVKRVLCDWDDDACIKILKRCRDAVVPAKGKVIVMDIVMISGSEYDNLFDLEMMSLVGGQERDRHEWCHLFTTAGFSSYKISTIIGSHCIIEVFL